MSRTATKDDARVDADQLIERMQKAKWENKSVRGGKAVRFVTPAGTELVVNEQYDSPGALEAVTKAAEEAGLLAHEEAQQRSQEALLAHLDKKARQEEATRPKPAPKKQLTDNDKARIRAAGPYLLVDSPELDVELDWFTRKHPAPWVRWVRMTPQIARYLLEHHNKPGKPGLPGTNRPQSEEHILYFRNLIGSNQMFITHQGMGMDTNGHVIDAQHRMAGLVAAADAAPDMEFSFITQFTVGLDPDNAFTAIDAGLAKRASQMFAAKGEAYGLVLQGATNLLTAVRTSDKARTKLYRKQSTGQLIAVFDADKQLLRKGAATGVRTRKETGMAPGPFCAGYYLICATSGEDNTYVQAFFDGFVRGYKQKTQMILQDDDPRKVLRRALMNYRERGVRVHALDQLGMLITTWNSVVRGEHRDKIKWKLAGKTANVPEVMVCSDSGPYRSTPPRAFVGELD